jgi:CheY-like chemotaxis protein
MWMKVLIVDDNEQARQMIKHYLHELSDEFRECADGVEAVSAYAEFLPD